MSANEMVDPEKSIQHGLLNNVWDSVFPVMKFLPAILSAVLIFTYIQLKHNSTLETLELNYISEQHAKALSVKDRIEEVYSKLYQSLRTLARLPGVRSLKKGNYVLDEDIHQVVQEIYNNLSLNIALSEVYIVQKEMDPEKIDPATGKAFEPIYMFDELIVNPSVHTANQKGSSTLLEDAEIHEYRLIKQQIDWLAVNRPTIDTIEKLSYPAVSGREVLICDSSRYDPHAPVDSDRAGLVYSVPYYLTDGKLGGVISGVMLSHALRDLLPSGSYVLLNTDYNYTITPWFDGPWKKSSALLETGQPDESLIYSERIFLQIQDGNSKWQLWVGAPDDAFWSSTIVLAEQRFNFLANVVTSLFMLAILYITHLQNYRIREEKDLLEMKVQQRTQELNKAMLSARNANNAKSEFLACMSHEIRTPLNGVLGMLELLSDTPLVEKQKQMVDSIRRSAKTLMTVINDVLDFSKIEAEEMDLEDVSFDINEVLHDVVSLFSKDARDRQIELVVSDCSCSTEKVIGDAMRLSQILINLVSNAIKFTEQGAIVVSVSNVSLADSAGMKLFRFEVRDSGIGIPVSAQSEIFESFSQADGSTTRKYGGSGLGLAICKRLVTLMGGEIGVLSEPGKGSMFWFHVQFKEQSDEFPVSAEYVAVKKPHVLVVDGCPDSPLSTIRKLVKQNFEAAVVTTADDALNLLRSMAGKGAPFDVAVLNGNVDGSGGIDLVREIKVDTEISATHLILFGAEEDDRSDEWRAAGVEVYLPKSSRFSDLQECILRLTKDGGVPGGSLVEPSDGDAGLLSGAVLVVEDNPVNREVAAGMLESLGCSVTMAENGSAALSALSTADFDLVLMDCHMPVLDGFGAVRIIREREQESGRGKHITVIALTASAMSDNRERCLSVGMDDFISKPFDKKTLHKTLSRWLNARSMSVQSASVESSGAADLLSSSVVDQDVLDGIRALQQPDSPDLLGRIIAIYFDNTPSLLRRMRAAIADDDPVRLREAAHSLKSSSANLGASELASLCNDLEELGRTAVLDNAGTVLARLERVADAVMAELDKLYPKTA